MSASENKPHTPAAQAAFVAGYCAFDMTTCPECGAVAEVTERVVLDSTAGPVEHVRVVCIARHWFLLPAASLGRASPAGRPARPPG